MSHHVKKLMYTVRVDEADQFFNDSTGYGQDGEMDARGPWNQGAEWQLIEGLAFQDADMNPGKFAPIASVDQARDRTKVSR
jgi:hypothetical protein